MAGAMDGVIGFLEKHLMPVAGRIGNQKHVQAIRDGIIVTMPLTIIGSVFLIIGNFPIPAYTKWLAETGIAEKLGYPVTASFGLMGVIACIGIAYRLSEKYNVDALTGAVLSLCTFVLVTPYNIPFLQDGKEIGTVGGIAFSFLDSGGLFVGLIMSIFTVEIYRIIVQKDIIIKMPDGVPPAVAKSFAALIPGMIILTVVWIIRLGLMYTPFEDMHNIVRVILVGPLTKIGGTYWGALVVTLLIHLLWMTGIHGAALIMGIISPVTYKLMAENNAAYMAGARGTELPHVVTTQFFDIFQSMGGSGSTFSLAIILFLFSKSKQLKEIGKLAVGPAFFNINEPILFGLPIVMNPLMLIPFVLSPVVVITITYWSMKLGLVSRLAGIAIPWTTPPVLGGALATASISGGVIQVISMVLTFFIYYPFFKIMDAQKLEEERSAVSA